MRAEKKYSSTQTCVLISCRPKPEQILRHSREGVNPPRHPSFPRTRKSTPSSVIPAKAEIQPRHPSFPRRRESNPIIRHSREGGNPQFPRMREFIDPYPNTRKKHHVIPAHAEIQPYHPSFPRRRESTIPAHAGIRKKHHRPIPHTPQRHSREKSTPSSVIPAHAEIHPVIRHSREGGNPFPRMREFNEKNTIQTNQTPHSHTGLPQRHSHESGNSPRHPSFPRRDAGIQRKKIHPVIRQTNAKTGHPQFPHMRDYLSEKKHHPDEGGHLTPTDGLPGRHSRLCRNDGWNGFLPLQE